MTVALMRAFLLATDHQRTPLYGDGAAVRRHLPYGVVQLSSGPRLGFCAQLRELSVDRYLLGNGRRVYNPVLMRFHSADRLSPFAHGGLNAYAYCLGDPVNLADPSGNAPLRMHGGGGLLIVNDELPGRGAGKYPFDDARAPSRGERGDSGSSIFDSLPGAASVITAASAVIKTADDVSQRMDPSVTSYSGLSKTKEMGYALAFWGGATGMVDKAIRDTASGPLDVSSKVLGIAGNVLANVESLAQIGERIVSGRVSGMAVTAVALYQVTGLRLLVTAASNQVRAGYEGLSGSGIGTPWMGL